jgi:FkbM family methyltransferase
VGANIGDTLAAMISVNPELVFHCIEADSDFYHLLLSNVENIKNGLESAHVTCYKYLIGDNITAEKLDGNNGSKHAIPNPHGSIKSVSLDNLLLNEKIDNIKLLKIDVDGFDYDVINSASEIIKKYKPLIFFEAQTDTIEQFNEYIKTINHLITEGYLHFYVFDNYGEFVIKIGNLSHLRQIMNYIWKQNIKKTTRTMYYIDVLCAQQETHKKIDEIISQYAQL